MCKIQDGDKRLLNNVKSLAIYTLAQPDWLRNWR